MSSETVWALFLISLVAMWLIGFILYKRKNINNIINPWSIIFLLVTAAFSLPLILTKIKYNEKSFVEIFIELAKSEPNEFYIVLALAIILISFFFIMAYITSIKKKQNPFIIIFQNLCIGVSAILTLSVLLVPYVLIITFFAFEDTRR